MNIREQASILAKTLKDEEGSTWEEMIENSNLSRKQVSYILSGKGGVSLSKIEQFFEGAFSAQLVLSVKQKLNRY